MAKYQEAFRKLIQKEGGYVNHPNDRGGDTYKGIARRHWPHLPVWRLIDPVVKKHNGNATLINNELEDNTEVQRHVENFYKSHFWDRVNADRIDNWRIANHLFFQAVHTGHRSAGRRLQAACNYLIGVTRAARWEQLTEDGIIGPKSLAVINKIDDVRLSDVLLYELRVAEVIRFKNIISSNESQRGFYAGWVRRVFSKL